VTATKKTGIEKLEDCQAPGARVAIRALAMQSSTVPVQA
jgi:hypothetical protein